MRFRHKLVAVASAAATVAAAVVMTASPASAANLLSNPGFESGSLSPWTCSAGLGSVVSTPVHSGTKALQAAPSASDNAQCKQTVSVQPSTTYTATAWVRGGGGYVYLGITGGTSTWNPNAASNWVQLSVSYTTGASQTSLEVYVNGWYGLAAYNVDDVSVDGPGGTGVPGTPGTPSVGTVTNTSIALSWAAASGTVTGYRVYEGSTVVATVTGTSATISSLGTCTSHSYTVAAYNGSGESAKSGAASATTTGCTSGVPSVPGNFRVTGTTASSISLAWNASTGTVTGYRVYEGTTVRATVTGTTATISGLAACGSHTYTVAAYNGSGESAKSASAAGTTTGCPTGTAMAAPYYYNGWGSPPNIATVMSATGVKQFTMAFMLSGGGCVPMWDSSRPLTGGVDQATINTIRANGGDVEISFGGWQGNKLGPNCSSASALAGAYQQVINAYNLKYLDVDIENTDEFESEVVQDRILGALKIVKQNNPGIKTILTFGTTTTGPSYWGTRLINQAAATGANVDVFTIMPFDFGGGADMAASTISAATGLKNALKTAFGWTDAQAYAHVGISGMNGYSDQSEITTTAQWTSIRNWANTNHIARLAFWSVNRDRGCAGGGLQESCSGIAQSDWAFTAITAGFTG
ncbi:carbohydrate binding domain-containing protein [Catellatospora sp. KI3]|uniref:fibronectin type III domain-containing protein n=1 Tax=Catellatospora sp. KI3 TaxID=3041620 RepID=UPI0024826B7D|nr:carbohydrate binding domain-containing protein [Catellatospora sp. KI3]MDI1462641.1 carbohydrate binding domain-containing protein [Catellatospora sp. KI3]